MGFGGVVQVGQGREVGEHAGGLVIGVVLLQSLDSGFEVGLVSVSGDVVVADIVVAVAGSLIELGAVGVGHAHGDEGGSGDLTGLADLFDDVVAVEQQADGVADLSLGLLSLSARQRGGSGEDVLVDVPADVVGADLAGNDEFIGILSLQAGDLVGGNVVDELPVAVLEVGEHVVDVVGEVEVDGLHRDLIGVVEVGVLDQRDDAVVLPGLHGVRAVADVGGRIGRPCVVGDDILTDREVGREGEELIPVRNIVGGGDLEGLFVERDNVQLCVGVQEVAVVVSRPHVGVAVNDLEHVAVVGGQLGGSSALPCECEITSGDRLAVGPDKAVTQGVGVGHGAVFVLNAFGQLGRCVGNDLQVAVGILGPLGQTGEQVSEHRSAVDGGVQSRVDGVGLGGQADIDDAALGACRLGSGIAAGGVGRGAVRGGRILGGVSGAAAGHQRENHDQRQQKSDHFFHFLIHPFKNFISICSAYEDQLISPTRWQATKWPAETSWKSGMLSAHLSHAYGQRVRKGQPLGAFSGLGISPESTMRWLARAIFGSGTGTADRSDLEYGCRGWS